MFASHIHSNSIFFTNTFYSAISTVVEYNNNKQLDNELKNCIKVEFYGFYLLILLTAEDVSSIIKPLIALLLVLFLNVCTQFLPVI